MANDIDAAVIELLKKVEKKKSEIEAAKQKPRWKTNCSFTDKKPKSGESGKIEDRENLITVKDLNRLVEMFAFFVRLEESLQSAAAQMGVTPNLEWLGYPIADWKDDIKARAGTVSLESKKVELAELDKRVNRLVSPEQRRAMELKALQELLKDE